MAADSPPVRLSAKHFKLLLLIHQGIAMKRAAQVVQYSLKRAGTVINSPLGQAYLAELRQQATALALGDPHEGIRALLDSEAMPSIKRIVALRDASDSERIQLNAANSLLDRTVPRKIQQAPPAATFVLPDKVADRLLKALQETAAIDVATAVEATLVPIPEDPEDPP